MSTEKSIITKIFESRYLPDGVKFNSQTLEETIIVGGNWYWKNRGIYYTQPTDKSKPKQEISAKEYQEVVDNYKASKNPDSSKSAQKREKPLDPPTKPYSEIDDEELVIRSNQGDKKATESMIKKYEPFVKYLAKDLFIPGGDKNDLVQEGLLGLVSAMKDYEPGKNKDFKQFAALVIKRSMQDAIRSANTYKNSPLNKSDDYETTMADEVADTSSPETAYMDKQDAKRLINYMKDNLSPWQQQVLGYYLQGYSYDEIAEKTGKDNKSINNAMNLVRARLRRYQKSTDESKLAEMLITALETNSKEKMLESYKYLYGNKYVL